MITDDTLTSLRENDERFDNLFFYLDDYSFGNADDDDELAQALRGNTQVTAVDVDMHLDDMNHNIEELMTGIGQLLNLQSLRCSSSGDYAVTMAALAKTLEASQSTTDNSSSSRKCKLVSLDLANFLLQNENDCDETSLAVKAYHDFVTALRHHPTMERFNLGFGCSSSPSSSQMTSTISPEVQASTAHYSLTPLFESLMTLPALDSVRLDGAGFASPTSLTPEGLATLCTSSSTTTLTTTTSPLTILEISDFDLSSIHIEAVAKALETNPTLKVLSLSSNKFLAMDQGTLGATCMAQILRSNNRLESLTLPLQSLFVESKVKGSKNTNKSNCKAMVEFFQAMEGNNTLKKLQLNAPDNEYSLDTARVVLTSPDVIEAFRHMLQHNYGLESIHIGYPNFSDGDWQAEINLHTKLNSMGRGRLVRDATITRAQWMDFFGAVQDDLSCLFHLLRLNPLLCSSSTAGSGDRGCVSAC